MKKEILEVMKSVLEDMSYYPSDGDTFYSSFLGEINKKLEEIKTKFDDFKFDKKGNSIP